MKSYKTVKTVKTIINTQKKSPDYYNVENMKYIQFKVEEYMKHNPDVALSVKSIAKKLGLRTRQVTFVCYRSELLRKVDPLKVGSNKTTMNTFKLIG